VHTISRLLRAASRNIVAQLTLSGIQYVFLLVVNVLVSRQFGREGLGLFSFLTALTIPIWVAMELGIDIYLVRELAAAPQRAHELCSKATSLRLLIASIVITLSLVASALTFTDATAKIGFILLTVGFLPRALGAATFSMLRAQQRYVHAMRIEIVGAALMALAAVVFLPITGSLLSLLAAMTAIEVVKLVLSIFIYRREVGQSLFSGLSFRDATLLPLLRTLVPFAVVNLLIVLHGRVDVIILEALRGDAAVGIFTAAERFMNASVVLPAAVFNGLLPILALLGKDRFADKASLASLLAFTGIGLLVTVMFAIAAPYLINLTFRFEESIVVLQILSLSFVFFMFNTVAESVLYSRSREHGVMWIRVAGIIVVLIANFMLVPTMGSIGTAWSVVLAEGAIALFFVFPLYRARHRREVHHG
jgi:O-antigen/teichoic acid export membrane protein